MSTGKNRFAQLARLGETVFHTKDLANLWQIKNTNTLYTTLTRYTKQGLLFRIYKGLYALKPSEQIDIWLLGVKALHKFAYISAETILAQAGIMQQNFEKITLISSKSKKFSIAGQQYYTRKLADKFLYQNAGIENHGNVKIATVARATADLLYFNPKIFFDNDRLINWRQVKKLQQEIGYPLTLERYDFTQPQRRNP